MTIVKYPRDDWFIQSELNRLRWSGVSPYDPSLDPSLRTATGAQTQGQRTAAGTYDVTVIGPDTGVDVGSETLVRGSVGTATYPSAAQIAAWEQFARYGRSVRVLHPALAGLAAMLKIGQWAVPAEEIEEDEPLEEGEETTFPDQQPANDPEYEPEKPERSPRPPVEPPEAPSEPEPVFVPESPSEPSEKPKPEPEEEPEKDKAIEEVAQRVVEELVEGALMDSEEGVVIAPEPLPVEVNIEGGTLRVTVDVEQEEEDAYTVSDAVAAVRAAITPVEQQSWDRQYEALRTARSDALARLKTELNAGKLTAREYAHAMREVSQDWHEAIREAAEAHAEAYEKATQESLAEIEEALPDLEVDPEEAIRVQEEVALALDQALDHVVEKMEHVEAQTSSLVDPLPNVEVVTQITPVGQLEIAIKPQPLPLENVDPAERTLRRDQKKKSQMLYLGVVQMINRTWGKVSEVLDFWNALAWSFLVDGKPVKYKLTPAEVLELLKQGRLEVDPERFARNLAWELVTDAIIGGLSRAEVEMLRKRYGNSHWIMNMYGMPSTWLRRATKAWEMSRGG